MGGLGLVRRGVLLGLRDRLFAAQICPGRKRARDFSFKDLRGLEIGTKESDISTWIRLVVAKRGGLGGGAAA